MKGLAKIITGVAACVILLATVFMFVNFADKAVCNEIIETESSPLLPPTATGVVGLGQGWYEFDIGTNRFLYHRSKEYSVGYESLTKIN